MTTNPTDPSGGHEPGGVTGKSPQSTSSRHGQRTMGGDLAGLSGDQRNAYTALVTLFTQYGLGDLAPQILKFIKQGYDQSTVSLLLQDTKEWKQRFAGNEELKKRGLAELDPATYLDLERTYTQVLRQYGIPDGMYGRSDFADWIGKSLSPSEIQGRVQLAAQAQYNADDYFRSALENMGIDRGHQIAYFMDTDRALPFLQRQFQAATISSSALRHHLGMDAGFADQLAGMGVSAQQAESGYATIGQELSPLAKLASLNNQQFGQRDFENALFLNDPNALARIWSAENTESARFAGSGGSTKETNARSLQGAY